MNKNFWKIILATSNAHKIDELRSIFLKSNLTSIDLLGKNKIKQLADHEAKEDGNTFYENALLKAAQTYKAFAPYANEQFLGTIADDSGLVVPALGGEPGLHSARYSKEGTDEANREKLVRQLNKISKINHRIQPPQNGETNMFSTPAYFVCSMVFYSERERKRNTIIAAEGKLHGRVISIPVGKKGFGYDPLFIAEGQQQTLAEISSQAKNTISHRFVACSELGAKIERFFNSLSIL